MISGAAVLLWGVAALLGTAVIATAGSRRSDAGTRLIYSLTLGISAAVLLVLASRIADDSVTPSTAALPLGLPWIGAHFRLDALSTFFLVVVNFGVRTPMDLSSLSQLVFMLSLLHGSLVPVVALIRLRFVLVVVVIHTPTGSR